MKKTDIRRPNPFLYHLAVPLAGVYARLAVGLTVDKSAIKGMKPPFVVICNHISNMDFLLSATAMHPYRMNYVAGEYLFSTPLARWAYGQMGAIPKRQFVPDPLSVRRMKAMIDGGGILIIFPSGQSSFTGAGTIIPPGIEKLLKLLSAPVVQLHIQGAHMCYPKWDRSKFRKTKVQVTASPLLGAEELRKMSSQEVYQTVADALAFDDYEWQRSARLALPRPRSAEGLHKVLFLCPKCHAEFTTEAHGNRLACSACGNAARMDEYGFLQPETEGCEVFDTPVKWHRWQMERLDGLLDDPGYTLESPVVIHEVLPDNRRVPLGHGTLRLSMAGLTYTRATGSGPDHLHVDSATAPVFAHESETSFDAAADGRLFSFSPDNPRSVFKFVALEELIFRRHHHMALPGASTQS